MIFALELSAKGRIKPTLLDEKYVVGSIFNDLKARQNNRSHKSQFFWKKVLFSVKYINEITDMPFKMQRRKINYVSQKLSASHKKVVLIRCLNRSVCAGAIS
jgi:hypothetical protein